MMKTALAVDCPDICLQNTAAYWHRKYTTFKEFVISCVAI